MSNSSTAKKKRGFARIEFLAVQPDAEKLLEAGHTFQSAYDELLASGKITMSYPMFAKYARNGVKPIIDQKPSGIKRRKTEEPPYEKTPMTSSRAQETQPLGIAKKTSFKKSADQSDDERIF